MNARELPPDMADRLIVALDVSSINDARQLVAKLDGVVSFFKIGPWLAFAQGVDGLIAELIGNGKQVFLDTKMYDIGKTVEEGVARAGDRGVSFVTVHGDAEIIKSAVKGRRGRIKILSITVLTSLSDEDLAEMGYRLSVKELVQLRVSEALKHGCDGIIASAEDSPDEIRRLAGSNKLLIATPGIRSTGEAVADHKRSATPKEAIWRGADYLVVGRPVITKSDPADEAKRIINEMQQGETLRMGGQIT